MVQISPAEHDWKLLPLRLVTGFGFAAHGYSKLSRGPDQSARILTAIGIPLPHLAAWTTSLLEFLGGIALMAGAFVVPLTLPLIAVMLTATFSVHFQYGFSSVRLKAITASGPQFGPIGYEMNLLYMVALLTLLIGGPGKPSFDSWLKTRKRAQVDSP